MFFKAQQFLIISEKVIGTYVIRLVSSGSLKTVANTSMFPWIRSHKSYNSCKNCGRKENEKPPKSQLDPPTSRPVDEIKAIFQHCGAKGFSGSSQILLRSTSSHFLRIAQLLQAPAEAKWAQLDFQDLDRTPQLYALIPKPRLHAGLLSKLNAGQRGSNDYHSQRIIQNGQQQPEA